MLDKEVQNCVVYARVSTENEGQKDSCANQIALCRDHIKNNSMLKIVAEYIDDGISGSTDNRPDFKKMIERVREGDIRYIIVKSSDRLNRSTEIGGYILAICRKYDVKIIYTSTGQIFDPFNAAEMMTHGFQNIIDQQTSLIQSEKANIAHKQKCTAKKLNATDVRYGYYWDYENKCMAVKDDEAIMIKKMFEWYVFGGLGVTEIARKLAEHGIYGEKSGKILTSNTISSRLTDSSYMGVFYINKRGSTLNLGMNAKTERFNRPKDEWIKVEGPAIITKELFELAQRIRKERRNIYDKPNKAVAQARFKGTHLFSSKIFCGDCGTQFHFRYSDRAKTIGEYKDYFSKKKKSLDEICNNKYYNRIKEDTLISICRYSINVFLKSHEECINNLVSIIKEASVFVSDDDTQINIYKKRLIKIQKLKNKNLEAWRDAPDTEMRNEYYEMYKVNKAEEQEIEESIRKLEDQKNNIGLLEDSIIEIKNKVEAMKRIEILDRAVVENFIDRINIHKDGRVVVALKFGTSFEAVRNTLETDCLISDISLNTDCFNNLKFIKDMNDINDINESDIYYPSVRWLDRA